ncbi:helix-turn-helix domain-containing protein [Paenibacillus abyssi]|uniref:HTH cro/C1-type domain-containing protein n=1 Tax=Paenibacillus abyssi TaxID=1340531 RepID=A0A917CGU4_9BACL|nr:helix-turn-helix transcriptional regulator [Paenibacillus abyssi]GGF88078.1 hypothetical protein GCM10010916_01730 [Paenibacillus abyssi]
MRYTIGRCYIPELLHKRGWTQRRLADVSGVSEKTISHYTTGERKHMTIDVAVSLADALGVSPRDLFEFIPVKQRLG